MNPSSVAEARKQVQTTCNCNKVRRLCLPACRSAGFTGYSVTGLLSRFNCHEIAIRWQKCISGQRVNMDKYCHVSGMNKRTSLSYSQPPYCDIQKSLAEFLFSWEMQKSNILCHMIQFINRSKMLNTSPFSYLKHLFVLAFLDILRFVWSVWGGWNLSLTKRNFKTQFQSILEPSQIFSVDKCRNECM